MHYELFSLSSFLFSCLSSSPLSCLCLILPLIPNSASIPFFIHHLILPRMNCVLYSSIMVMSENLTSSSFTRTLDSPSCLSIFFSCDRFSDSSVCYRMPLVTRYLCFEPCYLSHPSFVTNTIRNGRFSLSNPVS